MTNQPQAYALLDSGDFHKLERLGPYIIKRPAPQAIWEPHQPLDSWETADAIFKRNPSGYGKWITREAKPMENWIIRYGSLQVEVRLTDFGHIGLFPEQENNMDWLAKRIILMSFKPKILNLFAYTGGMTLAAAKAGAFVCHVDAVKGVVNWAKKNARLSNLEKAPVRWIVDDVMRFVDRQVKKQETFDGIILDPPSFGRGPKREQWKIEDDLLPLLKQLKKLFSKRFQFIHLSAHTPGYTPVALKNLVASVLPAGKLRAEELTVKELGTNRSLPSGTALRWEPS